MDRIKLVPRSVDLERFYCIYIHCLACSDILAAKEFLNYTKSKSVIQSSAGLSGGTGAETQHAGSQLQLRHRKLGVGSTHSQPQGWIKIAWSDET